MLKKFRMWLDKEIDRLKNIEDEDPMFIHGKCCEAVKVRAEFCRIYAKEYIDRDDLEKAAGEICDKYCIIPREWKGDNEDMIKAYCNKCPLTLILEREATE